MPAPDPGTLLVRQQAFGYSVEDVEMLLEPMGETGEEAVGSMGNDTPLAVLSDRPLPLFNYFKQLFAQVTNPPIDPIREQAVMSLVTTLGAGGNLLEQGPAQAKRLEMPHPVLTNHDLEKLRHVTQRQFPAETISMVFHRDAGAAGLVAGIERICRLASKQIEAGRHRPHPQRPPHRRLARARSRRCSPPPRCTTTWFASRRAPASAWSSRPAKPAR